MRGRPAPGAHPVGGVQGEARRVRAALRIGPLSKANAALLDEMHWVHRREQEANQMDRRKRRLLTRRQQAHCAALARAARLRSLLRQLGHSTKRCTCHDFDCWAPLWKIDASLALDLRARGFHFYDCALAPYDCQRGRVWDIKRPMHHPQPRPPLLLSNAKQEREIDRNQGSDWDSGTCSDEAAGEEDGSAQETGTHSSNDSDEEEETDQESGHQHGPRVPISDIMLARARRRSLLHLASPSCVGSTDRNGGVPQSAIHAECLDDVVPAQMSKHMQVSFVFLDLLAKCKYCDCELELGILRRRLLPELNLGFSCLSVRHGGDVHGCPAYCMHGCGEARFSMRWRAAMVPVRLSPGSDVGITSDDWEWLRKQCRVCNDWELGWCVSQDPREQVTACRVRVGFSGRVARPRKPAQLQFQLEEQSPYSRQDAAFGRRAWAYRARAAPWRQRPEWELDDEDVNSSWMRIDAAILAHSPPTAFADLAEKAVRVLGRWPTSEPQAPMVERRLAACLHAVLAHPRFHRGDDGSDAAHCWDRIYAIWQRFLAKAGASAAAAVTPCGMSDYPPHVQPDSSGCNTLLRDIGLDLRPMDAGSVFRHSPAKNMIKAIHRFHLIRRSPLFHGMELGQTCADNDDKLYEWMLQSCAGHENDGGFVWGPEGRLFMFQRHFDVYNHRGMSAEDPQALRWRPEKLLVDYTPMVTSADYMDAFCSLEAAERHWLQRCARSVRDEGAQLHSREVRTEYNVFGPEAQIWEILGLPIYYDLCGHRDCPEHADKYSSVGSHHAEDKLHCRPCISCTHNSLYTRRILFRPGGHDGALSNQIVMANAGELPFERFKIDWPLHPQMDALQWIGGTYAAHPQFFPREQLSPSWVQERLLPLGIAPPKRFQMFMDFNGKRWLCHADPTDFYRKLYPGIAKDDRPLPTPQFISQNWRTKYDWFTIAPQLYVPDEQAAAGRDKEWCNKLLNPHAENALRVEVMKPNSRLPATRALTNQTYVKSLPSMHTDRLQRWT